MRGGQDRSIQIMSRTQGWDPTKIMGDSYDVEKTGLWKDNPGPDAPSGEVEVSMSDKPWESPDVRPQGHPAIRHGDPMPGKPM